MKDSDMQVNLSEGLETLTITSSVGEELAAKGLYVPDKPEFENPDTGEAIDYYGQLPSHLADLDDRHLYIELEHQTRWGNYVNGELALAESLLAEAKAKEALAEAKIELSYRVDKTAKRNARDARNMAACDRYYITVRAEVLKATARVKYIQAIMKNTEDGYAVISRRITQRGQEMERDRRTGTVGNIPAATGQRRFR